jgi:hypothetical protein
MGIKDLKAYLVLCDVPTAEDVRQIIEDGAGYPLKWEATPELLQVTDVTTDEVKTILEKVQK